MRRKSRKTDGSDFIFVYNSSTQDLSDTGRNLFLYYSSSCVRHALTRPSRGRRFPGARVAR